MFGGPIALGGLLGPTAPPWRVGGPHTNGERTIGKFAETCSGKIWHNNSVPNFAMIFFQVRSWAVDAFAKNCSGVAFSDPSVCL